MRNLKHFRPTPRRRRAAAIVEMAVVTPILLLFLLGIIEFAHIMFVRHNLISAATQGARVGIRTNATEEMMTAAVEQALLDAGFEELPVVIESTIDGPPDTTVTCKTSVPYSEASIFGGFMPDSFIIGSACTMYR